MFGADNTLLLPIALVANQNLVNTFGSVLLNVGKPSSNVYSRQVSKPSSSRKRHRDFPAAQRTVERALVCGVVDEQDAHGSTVVGGGDGAETLLTGRIPDLELDPLAIEFDRTDFEVDADRGDEGRGEGILAEAQKTARLADTRVADQQQLDLLGDGR